jgi:hypothetical protein
METILDLGAARVFYDGLLTEPMLDHPEGLAVHRDNVLFTTNLGRWHITAIETTAEGLPL